MTALTVAIVGTISIMTLYAPILWKEVIQEIITKHHH